MGETLIENAYIATMDEDGTVYREGSILIEEDGITEIGPSVMPPGVPST